MPFSLEATVWSKPSCINCEKTKDWLDSNGVAYHVEDLTAPENADKLQSFLDMDFRAAPIVEVWEYLYDEGEWIQDSLIDTWAGFDESRLVGHFG